MPPPSRTSQSQMSNHYFTLGLTQAASKGDIRAAFQCLALIHHPDKGGDATNFRAIREAYNVLKDDVKRKQYDSTLPCFVPRPLRAKAPSPPPASPLKPEDFQRRRPRAAPKPAADLNEPFPGRAKPSASTPSRPGTPSSTDDVAGSDDERPTPRKDSTAHDDNLRPNCATEKHYMECPLPVEKCALCHFVPLRWCTSKLSAELLAENRRKRTITEAQRLTEQQAKDVEAAAQAKCDAERHAKHMAKQKDQPKTPAPDSKPATPAPNPERRQDPATAQRVAQWYPFRSATSPVFIQRARAHSKLQAAMDAEAAFGSVAW